MVKHDVDPGTQSGFGLRHWLVIVGAGSLMSLNVLLFMSMGLMLPPLADALEVGLGQVMLFMSINLLTGAVLMATAGPALMQRFGIRRLAVTGGVFIGITLYCVSFVGSLPVLYLLAAASGLFAPVSLQMTGVALVSNWFVHRRGLAMGLVMSFASMGGLVAGALLPQAVEDGGWQSGFRIVGATTIVVTLAAVTLLIRNTPADVGLTALADASATPQAHGEGSTVTSLAQIVRSRKFAALMTGLILYSAMMALQTNFSSIVGEHGISLAQAGSLIAMLSVANVFATLGYGALNDRRGPRFAYVLSGALMISALLVIRVTDGFALQAVGVLLFAIPAITPPVITPIILRHAFGNGGFESLLGIGMASMPIGIALGAPLWGLAKDVTGSYDFALAAGMAITCAVVGLVTYALRPSSEQLHA